MASGIKDKVAIQQVNFACFNLPDFMQWLADHGVGIGTPDIYVFKKFLTDTIYPLTTRSFLPFSLGRYRRQSASIRATPWRSDQKRPFSPGRKSVN